MKSSTAPVVGRSKQELQMDDDAVSDSYPSTIL